MCRIRLERVRARPAMTRWRAALHRTPRSILAVVFAVMVAAGATVAANITRKVTEAARKAPECTGAQAIARPAASWAIRPKTAKLTLLQTLSHSRLPPPPCRNRSYREKIRPSNAILSSAEPCLIKQRGPQQRTSAAAPHDLGRPTKGLW